MTIKSKFRLATILLLLFLLLGLGFAFCIAIKLLTKDNVVLDTKSLVGISFVFSLFVAGIIYVFAFTKSIELKDDSIVIKYLLRLKTFEFKFDYIDGYRWIYKNQSGAVDYKSIKIKTKENKTFTISDFEYSNFRELEKIITKKIALRITRKWLIPNQQEIEEEFKKSYQFDISQAQNIKILAYITVLGCIVFDFFIFKNIISKTSFSLTDLIFVTLLTLGLFLLVKKILKTNMYLKEIKNGA